MNKNGSDDTFTTNKVLPKSEKELTNTMASFYALQIALQTMKERCHQLQQRLSAVEDENIRLRIEKQRLPLSGSFLSGVPEEARGEVSVLQEHIAQLSRQKSQLTHNIYMVAAENKQLWIRLSKLTEANQSLGSHLTKISDTLTKHSLGESSKPNQSIQIMDSCERDVDNEQKDTSLEEISLKIISSFIREKIELEQQCDQMAALQSVSGSVEDCEFALGADPEQEELAQDLRRVLENLRDQRDQLQRQQAGLRATVATITSVVKNGLQCKKCKSADKTDKLEPDEAVARNKEARNKDKADVNPVREPPQDPEDNHRVSRGLEYEYFDEDRICPICSQFFHRSVKFEDFHSHVLTHFSEEEVDFQSLVTNNFEMVN